MSEFKKALARTQKLTKTENKILDFVIDHLEEACFMTSTDIAVRLGVSESSVIRFTRSMGYSGFIDFQRSIRKDYTENAYSISNTVHVPYERLKMSMEHSGGDYMEEFAKNTEKNIASVLKDNGQELYDAATEILLNSNRKYIVATRANTGVSSYFYLLLKHMLPDVYMANNAAVSLIDQMIDISKNDCVIIVSFPRYSQLDKLAAEMAKDAGARIIVITDRPNALLTPYADVVFTAGIDSNMFFNSYIGVNFLMESICASLSSKIGTGNEEKLKKIDLYLNQIGIY